MTKARVPVMKLALFLAGLATAAAAFAAGGGDYEPANTQVGNRAAMQRGAGLYMDYCAGCHSLKYVRWSRLATDLGLTEEQVMANLAPADAKFGDTIGVAMQPADGTAFFGKAPPDLSLVARSRGVDWIYTYLKSFYIDPTAAVGWNNTVYANASMPNALWELQGIQRAHLAQDEAGGHHVERLELASPGLQSPAQFEASVRDITTFLQYAGEPAILQRQAYGVWVLLYLALFTFIAWLLKQEYWKDVH